MIEVILSVPNDQLDALDDFLLEFGEPRWMLTQDLPTASTRLVGVFETKEEAEQAFRELAGASEPLTAAGKPDFKVLPDEDWQNSYKAHFKAWRFGSLHWVPTWERDTFVLPAGEQVIWLDPGLAFGTGNHETTRLCCERLVELAVSNGLKRSVIDAGCGSGILALSASALGFSEVVGFDNDPVAIQISDENAVANGRGGQIKFFVGDLITGLENRTADIVLANIQADVLMRFSANLLVSVKAGGALILSGILAREIDVVREVFEQAAPTWKTESRTMGEWSDLFLLKPL